MLPVQIWCKRANIGDIGRRNNVGRNGGEGAILSKIGLASPRFAFQFGARWEIVIRLQTLVIWETWAASRSNYAVRADFRCNLAIHLYVGGTARFRPR